MREPLGDLGLPIGGPAVHTGTPRIVHRLVGVDRLVAHPASPAITLGHIFKETHPSKLACPTITAHTRASGAPIDPLLVEPAIEPVVRDSTRPAFEAVSPTGWVTII
ncbi:hypothetical protein GCM10009665_28410 [Kitasatospora nipponensis]|uniref:Uncharacterized protein n=1 Tax=Kitasatospora nipponensis TaxID=258049 RepID=A0ABN1W5L1_9ACTN